MILHFLTDSKFADYPLRQFSSLEKHSEFVLIPDSPNSITDRAYNVENCRIITYQSPEFNEILTELHKYQAIVIHGIFWPWVEDVISSAPKDVKIAWYFWGGEIYSRRDIKKHFLAPLTKSAYNCHVLKKKIHNINNYNWELPYPLFQRVNYCLTSVYEEFLFAKQYLKHDKLKHIWYTYYSIEDTVGELINEQCYGNEVLFCNSVAIENNMFDALLYLSHIKNRRYLEGRNIIMPMGYGEPWIKNAMIKSGKFLFGNNFYPIKEFLPRHDYNIMMRQCSTLILPYWSPAAQGNIITGLWLGMRVYLSKRSMSFIFFKRIGAIIFSLENDFSKYHYTKLSNAEIEINRSIMLKWYGKEHVQQSAYDVLNTLTSEKWQIN